VTDKGALALNDYARNSDPFSKIGKTKLRRRLKRDPSLRRQLPRRMDRTRYVDDSSRNGRWSAILHRHPTPTDADRLRRSLGVYVHALNWSKELD